jgi:putative endonuclease
MTAARARAYRIGHYAEYLAAAYFWLAGYRIVCRRYKTPVGEIDLIVRKHNTIVFAEVKYRPDMDAGASAVRAAARGRIERAAAYYLAHGKEPNLAARFDVIAISPPFFIRHIDNAWRPRS